MRRQAVGGYHVEARAGQQHDFGAPRVFIHGGERLEARDLAADVHVMAARHEAGLCHLPEGVDERPGAVQRGARLLQRGVQGARVVQRESAVFESQRRALFAQAFFIPPGQQGTQALCNSQVGDQLSGVAIGAVEQESVHVNIIA